MTDATDDNSAETADPELTELVAYLDGELDEVAVDVMERRLVADAPLRQRAESLDKTWQLLDSLEEVSASGEFTQRTLSSMTAAVSTGDGDASGLRGPVRSSARLTPGLLMGCFLGSFLCAAAGIWLGNWMSTRARDASDVELLRNLDLLENYFSYRHVPSLKFLEDLTLTPSPQTGETPK